MDTITLGTIVKWASYWITFWTIVNVILPPRETFADFPGFLRFYNVVLKLVAFYGALNVRQFTVQLYGKLGMELEPTPTPMQKAQTKGFELGVDAAKDAVEKVEPPKPAGGN